MRARVAAIGVDDSRAEGERAARRLMVSALWEGASGVLVYASVRGEIDALPLACAAWRCGRRVYLPNPRPETVSLSPVEWPEGAALVPGPYGIPVVADAGGADETDIGLVIVPGLAFDRAGGRLGSGLGYYDRFLAAHAGAVAVGLAYAWQVVERVPAEAHDVRLAGVVTPDALWIAAGATP